MILNHKANWITMPENGVPAPLFKKDFIVTGHVKNAVCTVCGLGAYIMTLDGSRVNDYILNPRFSNYDKTVYFNSFELNLDSSGPHTIGICLGRGRHSMLTKNTWGWHKPFWDIKRKFIMQIEIIYSDGSVQYESTDGSWICRDGPIRFDCLYAGEIYDANYEVKNWDMPGANTSDWQNAQITSAPKGELRLQTSPPIRPIRTILPKTLQKTSKESLLYTFDENIAGNVKIEARGQKGSSMKIRYGEKIYDDLTVNNDYCNIDGEIQTDFYIFASDKIITYEPFFSYKGYQYVEVILTGDAEILSLIGIVYHNDILNTGTFSCSSNLLNAIHENCRRAILSNMHHVVTDTPIYEKNGWTGDAQLTSSMAMYNYNIDSLYTTWLMDFSDAQLNNGELPPIIPSPGWGYTSSDYGWEEAKPALPAWDFAYFEITRNLYIFYGELQVVKDHYDNLVKYLEFLGSCAEDFIIKTGLGDWLAPVGEDKSEIRLQPLENQLSSTAYFYQMSKIVAEFAGILKKPKDEKRFKDMGSKIKTAFNNCYFDSDRQIYRLDNSLPYRQTPNIIPLAFDMIPEEYKMNVVNNLVNNIEVERNGHLWCGIIGTRYILDVLSDNGYFNTAYNMISQNAYPSWGYWIGDGATSLYEDWELDTRSKNHHMYGSVDSWFYSHLAGIKTDGPGFKKVIIKPYFPDSLDTVNASFNSIHGKIVVAWSRTKDNKIRIYADLPQNTDGIFINSLNAGIQLTLSEGINEFII